MITRCEFVGGIAIGGIGPGLAWGQHARAYPAAQLESPSAYGAPSRRLLAALGIETRRFYTAYDQGFDERHVLTAQTFFDRATYGVDRLVPVSFQGLAGPLEKPFPEVLATIPLSPAGRLQLARLYGDQSDPFIALDPAARRAAWDSISIADFLRRYRGCGDEVVNLLMKQSLGYWGVPIDALAASDGAEMNFIGCGGLLDLTTFEAGEPYIFHFPHGNASIARLLVRRLVPGVAPGSTMDDIVTARFDYARLDAPDAAVRIRLNATAVRLETAGG
jgi:spermidine dehydrogenase